MQYTLKGSKSIYGKEVGVRKGDAVYNEKRWELGKEMQYNMNIGGRKERRRSIR